MKKVGGVSIWIKDGGSLGVTEGNTRGRLGVLELTTDLMRIGGSIAYSREPLSLGGFAGLAIGGAMVAQVGERGGAKYSIMVSRGGHVGLAEGN